MAEHDVVESIQKYMLNLQAQGIPVAFTVLYGSYARGQSNKWSDIDLIVVSPLFDSQILYEDVSLLWRVAGRTDSRIEPIPCGEKQWIEDDSRAIIEIARREGKCIMPAA